MTGGSFYARIELWDSTFVRHREKLRLAVALAPFVSNSVRMGTRARNEIAGIVLMACGIVPLCAVLPKTFDMRFIGAVRQRKSGASVAESRKRKSGRNRRGGANRGECTERTYPRTERNKICNSRAMRRSFIPLISFAR